MAEPGSVDALGRVLPSLALIVAGLLAVRWWARRGGARVADGVRVLARAGLSRGASVAVVQIGQRRFLLGAGEQRVSLLAELAADDGLPADPASGPAVDHLGGATDGRPAFDRPRMGLMDRLRARTVRTHLEGPVRARLE